MYDGIVGDPKIIQQFQQLANMHVVLDHSIGILIITLMPPVFFHVGAEVHACAIPPAEEWFAGFNLFGDELFGGSQAFIIDGFHPFFGQGTCILNTLAALAIGPAMDHAARTEAFFKCFAIGHFQIARIVFILRLFFGVQVVEVTKEFIKSMHGGKMLVQVTLVVLTELSCRIAQAFHDRGDGDIGFLPAFLGTGQAHLGHTGPNGNVSAEECRPAGRARLLGIVICKANPFTRDPINIRGLEAHHTPIVVADVPGADIITPDHEDIGLLLRECCCTKDNSNQY